MDVQSSVNKKVTVIGNGALPLGVAVQMAQKGAAVTYVDVTGKTEKDCVKEYTVSGACNYSATVHFVSNKFESVKDADIVIFGVTGSLYDTTVKNAIEFIRDGQLVAFFPACFLAINFLNEIRLRNIDITVCESVSFIYVCEVTGESSINIQCKKSSMKVAVYPEERAEDTIGLLNQYFEVMSPAKNLLETSMDNMNITLHPLPILLNIAAAERDVSSFYHYTGGVSPTVGKLMEKIDAERLEVGKAFGLNLTSAYDQLVEYYGERNLPTMQEYVSSDKGPYTAVKGFGLNSRYIEEDIPFLVLPAAELGKICGIKTPIMDLCIELAGYVHGKNYRKTGFSLEKMGFMNLSKEEILTKIC